MLVKSLFATRCYSEALATFCTTTRQYFLSAFCSHTFFETMSGFATFFTWLIGSFWHLDLLRSYVLKPFTASAQTYDVFLRNWFPFHVHCIATSIYWGHLQKAY